MPLLSPRAVLVLSLGAALLYGGPPAAKADDADNSYRATFSTDAPGAADNPLTGRYGGSFILSQTTKPFDELALPAAPAGGKSYSEPHWDKMVKAEGKVTRTIYVVPEERSTLEVIRNYTDSLKQKGFESVFECSTDDCGEAFPSLKYSWNNTQALVIGADYEDNRNRLIPAMFDTVRDVRYALMQKTAPEGVTLVGIYTVVMTGGSNGDLSDALTNTTQVLLESVEPKTMEARITTIAAAEIGSKLSSDGRAAFYGIYFDFDKAELKPESDPQLTEMAKLLTGDPAMRVYITGHTDNKGKLDYNLDLSSRRAKAVVAALGKRFKVPAAQMTPKGLGPLAPIAANTSEEGQAKNRRVEMVVQ